MRYGTTELMWWSTMTCVGLRKRLHVMLTFVACGTGLIFGLGLFAPIWAVPHIMQCEVCGGYPSGLLADSVREGMKLDPSEWPLWLKENVERACKLFVVGIGASLLCNAIYLLLIAALRRDLKVSQ
jgi:hypothetical protein